MPIIRWTGIDRISHIDGVFRYPDATERVSEANAKRYTSRRLADYVCLASKPALSRRSSLGLPLATASTASSHIAEELLLARNELTGEVDIVIPCYRSERQLAILLSHPYFSASVAEDARWNLIVVIDGDGSDPCATITSCLHASRPVRVLRLRQNTGFAHAVNTGARRGHAPFVLMLNADVRLLGGTDFLAPLLDAIRPSDVGAAGGLQLTPDGLVSSCGSEYDPALRSFEHALKGASPDTPDPYLQQEGPRDMLTGSCLLVRRSLWESFGGLDEGYRIGYWEDTDLCLRIRHSGHRIIYTPASVIEHAVGHSGASGHRFVDHNRERFHRRWVDTGVVDRAARERGRDLGGGAIVLCMIVLNEEEYVAASLASAYDIADRIVVVEGGVGVARSLGLCDEDGRSLDHTVSEIRSVPDPENKITLIRGFWPTKNEMRAAATASLRPGEWLLMLDGDEVLYDETKWQLLAWRRTHRAVNFPVRTFWNDFDTVATGVWDTFRPARFVQWQPGMHYRDHLNLVDARGRTVGDVDDPHTHVTHEPLAAHYAYVKPLEKIRSKLSYYARTTGRIRRDYFENIFLHYRRDPRAAIRLGTHPFGGGGAERRTCDHPAPINELISEGQIGAQNW